MAIAEKLTTKVSRPYRIDFALMTLTGNITRYKNMRPIVESDPEIESTWFPIRTWYDEDPLRFLPGAIRLRLRQTLDTIGLYFKRPPEAVVLHAFETYYLYTLFTRLLGRKTVIVNNPDGPVSLGERPLTRFLYQQAVARTDLFVLWSNWGKQNTKERFPHIPAEKMVTFHAGIDLRRWPQRPDREPGDRFKVLFVGGDAQRKGLNVLLQAFETHLSNTCELHVATQSGHMTSELHEWVSRLDHTHLYLDLPSGSEQLKRLFAEADCFVLPTFRDASSWVAIEAMATGIPVVITPVGGIPDIVIDGETGLLVPVNDPASVANAVTRLRSSPELRHRLAQQGRVHVEENFDGEKNNERLMSIVKDLIDVRVRSTANSLAGSASRDF